MKTALITGSSKGLGARLALVFARNGYNIILHGRDEKKLKAIEQEIFKQDYWIIKDGIDCEVVKGDLRSTNTLANLYAIAKKTNLDILINNAGIYEKKHFQDMDFDDFLRILTVNLIVPIQLIKRIYPIFLEKKSGLIININSLAGKNPNEMEAAYCASKYGLRGFMDSFQIEANRNNVKIINVYLGAMQTTITEEREDKSKLIQPEEAANAIFRMCKDYKSLRITEVNLMRRIY